MKKLFIFLTAIAMFGLVSCESDKQDISRETAVSEPIEEIPTEPVFTEYNANDFKEINVALNKMTSEPPVNITEIDLSGVLDEKIISPCKLPENREMFKEISPVFYEAGNFDELCDTAFGGSVRDFALDGDTIYILVNYDLMCNGNHCHKILAYDIKTETLSEAYSYSSTEDGDYLREIFAFGGELYVIREIQYEDEMSRLENGEFETVLTANELSHGTGIFDFYENAPDGFILRSYKVTENNYENSLYKYDPESDSVTEIYYDAEEYEDFNALNIKAPVFFGDEIITTELDEDKNTCIVGENFRLNTGVRGVSAVTAGGGRISVLMEDTIQSILYTYDLDKKECYISDVSDKTNRELIFSAGENIVFGHYSNNMDFFGGDISYSLLMPDIGAYFSLGNLYVNSYYSDFFGTMGRFYGYNSGRFWTAESVDSILINSAPDEDGISSYEIQEGMIGKFIIVGE